jgi:myo-inositol-1(or 4)-monophosphatase
VSDGEIQLGTVYEPYVDRLFFGKKGNGATLNGLPIQVSTISDTKKAIVAISRYKTFTHNDICNQQIFQHLMTKLDTRISASTALDMCNVASGVIEGRIMANTRMWDNSAATLLIQEAGGIVTCWDGGSTKLSSDKLVASNGLCHDAIIKLLNDDNYRVDE